MSSTVVSDSELLTALDRHQVQVDETLEHIRANPELAHEERRASDHLVQILQTAGFQIERGGAGPTAFVATLHGARRGKTVALVALYDAVPVFEPGGGVHGEHSCGHDAIAAGVVGAALALAGVRERLAGTVVVVGCPADEIPAPGTVKYGSGKVLAVEAGLWDGIDAALYAHPEFETTVFRQSRWMRRERAAFETARLLEAACDPVVDAVARIQAVAASFRGADVLLERLALDGDVEEGGRVAVGAHLLVRADSKRELDQRCATLRGLWEEATWTSDSTVMGLHVDGGVTAAVRDAVSALGYDLVDEPPGLPFATDFGNVSHCLPSALIGVGRPGGFAFHTSTGVEQFAANGLECSMSIARVLALSALRLGRPG